MRIAQSRFGIPLIKYYFTQPPLLPWREWWIPVAYMDCYELAHPYFFKTVLRHTLITDLTLPQATLFQGFNRVTRSQIRQYQQEQFFTLNLSTPLEQFMPLYNAFARSRSLSMFSCEDASTIGEQNYRIFGMEDAQGKPLLCHFYLLGNAMQTVNLLISASTLDYREDQSMSRLLARANRYLHWQGMCHFKEAGFQRYDWGGYVPDTPDPVMQGINRFKKTFNGQLTPIYNYYSPSYAFIEYARQMLRKWRPQESVLMLSNQKQELTE